MSNLIDEIERHKKGSLHIATMVVKANPHLYPMYVSLMGHQETLLEWGKPCHEYVDSDLLQKLGDTSRDVDHAILSIITMVVMAQCLDVPRYKNSKRIENDRLSDIEKHVQTILNERYEKEND